MPIQCSQKECLWRAFHKQSVEELPSKLYMSLSLADMEEKQTVNVVMYEQLLKQHFVTDRPSKGGMDDDQLFSLSTDVSSSYSDIPHKLKRFLIHNCEQKLST